MKNNETGRSMVEMLGVLAIIGVLSAGGLAGYSKAMFKHKLNSTMDQITMLVTNIRTMYGTQGNYAGLNGGTAYDLGIVPAVMAEDSRKTETVNGESTTTGSVSLTNPFKGSVDIITADATDKKAGTTAFIISYDSLPQEACIALAPADFGSGAGSGFIGVQIFPNKTVSDATATAVDRKIGSGEGQAYDIDGATADSTGCAAGSKNTVAWKFY